MSADKLPDAVEYAFVALTKDPCSWSLHNTLRREVAKALASVRAEENERCAKAAQIHGARPLVIAKIRSTLPRKP